MSDVDIKIRLEAAKAEADLRKFTSQVQVLGEKEKQAALQTQILQERLNKVQNAGKNAGKGLNVANIALASFVGNITSRIVSSAVTSLINGFQGLVNAGRDFQDGLVAVGKTTGIEGASLARLGDRITDLSSRIPVATNNLLEIATVAGQLGLKSSSDIIQFTETLGKLELATDIVGEEGAQSVARILTITGELEKNGSENINKFGNVITRLGNDFAATESQILQVANRVAKGVAPFGVASEDVLAFSTALKATGSEAEASGTAIQKTFLLIGEATQEGGEKLRNFAQAAGLSDEAFVELFKKDPAKLFQVLTKNLGQTSNSGAELNATLKQLGLSDVRLINSLNPLIARYGELEKALATARKEAQDKTALDEESSKAADTLSGDIQQLSNAFSELGKELFKTLGPILREIVQTMTGFTQIVSDLVRGGLIEGIIGGLGGLAVALTVLNAKTIFLSLTALPGLILKLGAVAAEITIATGGLNLLVPAIAATAAAIGVFIGKTQRAAEEQERFNLAIDDAAEGYKELDEETTNYLDSLSEYTRGVTGANSVELALSEQRARGLINLVEMTKSQREAADADRLAIEEKKKLLFFEQDKVKQLKKFFSEEEQARLESNFAILKDLKEREAFTRIFAAEGTKRQREAYLAKLGLDRATVEAERKKQEELKQIRSAQEAFEEDLRQKEEQRLQALQSAKQDAALADEALRLFQQQEEQIFNEERLVALQDYFTREEEARIQAGINAADNEVEKQILINQAMAQGQAKRLAMLQKQKEDEIRLEEIKKQALLNTSANLFGALASLARAGGQRSFGVFKALAKAQAIISAYASINKTMAEPNLPWPANVIQSVAIGAQAFANVANINRQQPSFETGGVVPGSSFTGDNVTARVNSGEMILNRQQQSQLFKMANGQGVNGPSGDIVVHTTVELDGEKVGESVSRQVANGLVLGEVQ